MIKDTGDIQGIWGFIDNFDGAWVGCSGNFDGAHCAYIAMVRAVPIYTRIVLRITLGKYSLFLSWSMSYSG